MLFGVARSSMYCVFVLTRHFCILFAVFVLHCIVFCHCRNITPIDNLKITFFFPKSDGVLLVNVQITDIKLQLTTVYLTCVVITLPKQLFVLSRLGKQISVRNGGIRTGIDCPLGYHSHLHRLSYSGIWNIISSYIKVKHVHV